jgi:hypothetical protein
VEAIVGTWTRQILIGAAVATVAGCATTASRRDAYIRARLDDYRYPKPLDQVWPSVQMLLSESGYPLVGKDREAVGQSARSSLLSVLSAGMETSPLGGSGLVLETNFKPSDNTRYRVEGRSTPNGTCRIVFTLIKGDPVETSIDERIRDYQMELDLAARVDPDGEARMESSADAAAQAK